MKTLFVLLESTINWERLLLQIGRSVYVMLFSFVLVFLSACKKEKLDFTSDNRPEEIAYSNLRIMNFGFFQEVTFNGDTLTYHGKDWMFGNPPTQFFQEAGGLMGISWKIPKALFKNKDSLELGLKNFKEESMKFQLPSNPSVPLDYYTLPTEGVGQPWAVPVPRDTTLPKKAAHFKIRVINLTKALPALPIPSQFGPLENLYGAVTLAYADGTAVSPETSNIGTNQRVSSYVEVPYGAYQLKVLTSDGRQISAGVHGLHKDKRPKRKLNPPTSRIDYVIPDSNFVMHSSNTYAPLKAFEPGGVYTIVVVPQYCDYYLSKGNTNAVQTVQNQFQIIEDRQGIPNRQFFKVQAINAGANQNIRVQIDGKEVSPLLNYGEYADARILNANAEVLCEVKDTKGNVLASKKVVALANQNISLWVWRNKQGSLEIVPVYNNLSQEMYSPVSGDYGGFNRYEYTSYAGMRFFNFSADESYINFTLNDGQLIKARNIYVIEPDLTKINLNLEPGLPKIDNPYSIWDETLSRQGDAVFHFKVYRSITPEVNPGTWVSNVPFLPNDVFVTNPVLYTNVGREVPRFNTGVYSIALIGSTKSGASNQARIICIKHSK